MPSDGASTRWGPESPLTRLTGLKTAITAPMTLEQIDAYALLVRVEELTLKLTTNDVNPANRGRRSPSPEPRYDASGRRVNTRERRYREALEEELDTMIQRAVHSIPNYRLPRNYVYKRQRRKGCQEKIYIPVRDFPEINFIGQLLGPRGRSLTEMNKQSGANIVIRGKGSVKEGRFTGRQTGARGFTDNQDEPLHCLITADVQHKVDNAKELIQTLIETIVTAPSQANARKQQQLRELAIANGTFRDDEGRGDGLL